MASVSLAIFFPISAIAQGLMDFYKDALENDPKYQSALHERKAGKEFELIGKAGLLPSVSTSLNYSANQVEDRKTFGTSQPNLNYDSKSAVLSARQPIFNWDAWQRFHGGRFQSSFSDAKLASDKQDLILRLATAYLDALLAEDQLRLSTVQLEAYTENRILNQQLFEKGAGTLTDVLETAARFELANAGVLEAQNNVTYLRTELSVIVGKQPGALLSLAGKLPALHLEPTTLDDWENLSLENNPEVLLQRFTVEFQMTEAERLRGGHLPRIDLVASISRSTADSLATYSQESTLKALGFQLSLPLYNGGGVSAQVRQAISRVSSGQADLVAIQKKTISDVRKYFNLLNSTYKKINAIERAEMAASETIKATRRSVTGGYRVNLDVLMAIQQLYQVEKDLSEARHAYLMTYLRLHAAAGVLNEDVLSKISVYFR